MGTEIICGLTNERCLTTEACKKYLGPGYLCKNAEPITKWPEPSENLREVVVYTADPGSEILSSIGHG